MESKRKNEKEIIQLFEGLSDSEFIQVFRGLLNKNQYNYPDESVLKDRYNSILVLLSDISQEDILAAVKNVKNKKTPLKM